MILNEICCSCNIKLQGKYYMIPVCENCDSVISMIDKDFIEYFRNIMDENLKLRELCFEYAHDQKILWDNREGYKESFMKKVDEDLKNG